MLTRRQFQLGSGLAALFAQQLKAQAPADPLALELHEASALLSRGELTPLDLTQAFLQRIERDEPRINAFVSVTADLALEQARVLGEELQQGRWRGPLHGIPIALKDNIDTAGIRTTAANALFAERIPASSAPVWQRLQDAGAILLGKCNMHEFAYGGSSAVSHVGAVRNPWNTAHIPGGSSGGSAAAVAARFCLGALGTDTLASIRLPASYCGVTGFKPTHGLSSIRGIIPVSETLDHVGPIARSAADCALLLAAMAGFDPLDPASAEAPAADLAAALQLDVKGLRLGLPRSPYYDDLHPDVASAMDAALIVLQQLTSSLQDVSLPATPDFALLLAESYAWHEPLLANPDNHQFYDASTLERILAAGRIPVQDYIRAQQATTVLRRTIGEVFRKVDILVTPTAPGLPEPIANAAVAAANSAEPSVRNTAPFNLSGIPTIALPCGFSRDGLPIGLQLSSARFDEARLLALAHAFQQVTDWHRRSPPPD
jgi:aspartyl-tRNA(Asn)/glutamyl-tRNA(Gln) amidotransferase subunit A